MQRYIPLLNRSEFADRQEVTPEICLPCIQTQHIAPIVTNTLLVVQFVIELMNRFYFTAGFSLYTDPVHNTYNNQYIGNITVKTE